MPMQWEEKGFDMKEVPQKVSKRIYISGNAGKNKGKGFEMKRRKSSPPSRIQMSRRREEQRE
jgi:hypothetical protein